MDTPAPVYRLVALNGKAVALIGPVPAASKTQPPKGATVTEYPSAEAAKAAIATLKLVPYITKGDKLAALFATLAPSDQATYQILFVPIGALVAAGRNAEAIIALNALTVPPALQATLAQMVAILK